MDDNAHLPSLKRAQSASMSRPAHTYTLKHRVVFDKTTALLVIVYCARILSLLALRPSLHLSSSILYLEPPHLSLSASFSPPCCLSLSDGANLFSTQRVSVH